MNKNVLKIISVVATLVSVGVSLTTKWVDDKNLDRKISEEVAKQLTKEI